MNAIRRVACSIFFGAVSALVFYKLARTDLRHVPEWLVWCASGIGALVGDAIASALENLRVLASGEDPR